MTVYLMGTAISTCLFALRDKSRGVLRVVFAILGLCIPATIAGYRDDTIGTDVLVYAEGLFTDSASGQTWSYIQSYWIDGWKAQPSGYVIFTWIIAQFCNNLNVYLFILQLITIVPIFLSLRYFSPNSTYIGMFCYCMLLFPFSLNIMKQLVAVALVMLSLIYCDKKQPIVFVAIILVAYCIHQTAIMMLVLYPLYQHFANKQTEFTPINKLKWYIMVLSIIIIILALGKGLIQYLPSIKGSYSYIVERSNENAFHTDPIVFICFILLFEWWFGQKANAQLDVNVKQSNIIFLFAVLSIIGFGLSELSIIADGLDRVSAYGISFFLLYFELIRQHRKDYSAKVLSFVLVVFIVSHFIRLVIAGYGEIYPYTSTILGIV